MDESEFKQKLNPEQYRVMRERGTEVAHTGKYFKFDERGAYLCAACGRIVFLSINKKKSNDGYPAFTRPAGKSAVVETKDAAGTEVACAKCASHLGYRLEDKYYQINSIALDFQELPDIEWEKKDGESDGKNSQQPAPKTNTWTLTIGGITIGAALGAGAMYAAAPQGQLACLPCEQQQNAATLTPSTVTNTTPSGSGTAGTPRGSSGALQAQSATIEAAPSSATSTSADGSAGSAGGSAGSADGTAGSADGTI